MSLFRYSACSFALESRPRAFVVALGVLASGLLTSDPTQAVGVHSTLLSYSQSTGNGHSTYSVANQDGSIVAFRSSASNLADGDTNGVADVLVLSRTNHTFEIASRASGVNGAIGNGESSQPDLNLSGQLVVFYSRATNLVPEDSGAGLNIFLRDREAARTELIDIADPGAPVPHAKADSDASAWAPRISANGCRVVFASLAKNLVANMALYEQYPAVHHVNIYLRDRCADRTILVSRPIFGLYINANSGNPVISRDGRIVAFASRNSSLPLANEDGDFNDTDVFVYDVEADAIVKRLDFDSMPSGFSEGGLDIDSAGEFVVGLTYLPKSPADTNTTADVYVADTRTGSFELQSANSDGSVDWRSVAFVSISGDGKRVAFNSDRNLTGELREDDGIQAWIRDRTTQTTRLVSRRWQPTNGTIGAAYGVSRTRIYPSGEGVTFGTLDNLDPRDNTINFLEVYASSTGYSFQVLDPNPDLIDGGEVTVDPERLKVYGRPVNGVAADGVTRLLLRFQASQSGTVRFSIADENHAASEFVGSLSSVGGNQNELYELDVPVVTVSSGEKFAYALLQAPEGFDRTGNSSDSTSRLRPFFVSATDLGTGASIEVMQAIVRPPVALVHGVWSSFETWEYALLQSPVFDTFLHDYKPTNAASFSKNSYEAVVASWDALEGVRSLGYAATQADYIGHSMGGLLARQWVAGDYCEGECNLRADNFFTGDLNRLITLGTPHAGSELANALWAMWEQGPPRYAWPLRLVKSEMCVDCGAIQDMRAPILDQGAAIVPAHAVVGTGGQEDSSAKGFLIEALLGAYLQTTRELVFGLGVQHDGIVKRSSQEGGLLPPNVTVIEPTETTHAIHTSEPKEAAFGSRMEELLRLSVSAEEFAPEGFPALDSDPGILAPLRAPIGRGFSRGTDCQDTCLDLQIVAGGPVFHPGDEVTLEATGLEKFEPQRVLFLFGDQELLVDESPFVATFAIPMNALGEIVVGAVAKGQETLPPEALYQFDFVDGGIDVEQEATLQGLRLEPAVIKNSPAFPGRTLRVYGVFSDNVDRELTGYPISFTSSDTAVAAVTDSGEVHFLRPGIATVVVSYDGLEANVPVEISSPPIALQVVGSTSTSVTVVVDKLRPLQSFRIFGTTDLGAGHTTVAKCLRLDLGLRSAEPVTLPTVNGEDTTHMQVTIPLFFHATRIALQVVTDECAISPVVIADTTGVPW